VDEQRLRDLADRDRLWASLVKLLPEIEALAAGRWEGTEERRGQLARLLAGVVAAELHFQSGGETPRPD